MEANLRRGEVIWLIEKPALVINNDDAVGFQSFKPPTNGDVFVYLKGYHNYLQLKTKRQSTLREACMKVYEDVVNWWKRTGIEIMSKNKIIDRIIKLHNTYQYLYRHRENQDKLKDRKQDFKEDCVKTFWPVSKIVQKNMEQSTDKRTKEDFKFLSNMKTTRDGGIGTFDRKKAQTEKRKIERKQKTISCVTPNENSEVVFSDDDEEEEEEYIAGTSAADRNFVPKSSTKKQKKTKIDVTLTEEKGGSGWKKQLFLIGDKYGSSNRCLTETTSAFLKTGGVDLHETKLSLSTVWRQRRATRESVAQSIVEKNMKLFKEKLWSLHWDGKLLKSLQHVGVSQERIAVILKSGKEEILLEILKLEGRGNAENVTNSIMSIINSYEVDCKRIISFVYDTTSLNTGTNAGVVKLLEEKLNKKCIQAPCRHHVFELVAAAACNTLYGQTSSPFEPVFKTLQNEWAKIDTKLVETYDKLALKISRTVSSLINDTILFLQNCLNDVGESCLRKDYKELVVVSLIFLKGVSTTEYKFIPPGACHHARWMAKIIYTIKLTIFQDQLSDQFSLEFMKKISSLSLFLCLFYVKTWICAPVGVAAPKNDLNLLKDFNLILAKPDNYPEYFTEFALAAQNKLKDHLWYLSERLVPLCLFSDRTLVSEKQAVRRALLKYRFSEAGPNMSMPVFDLEKSTTYQLQDFIGPDSWTFLDLVTVTSNEEPSTSQASTHNALSFLETHPSKWGLNPAYLSVEKQVQNLTVVNDAAERGLALVTEFHNKNAPKDENQKQFLLKIVKEMRAKQAQQVAGTERVTKSSLNNIQYEWS